MAELHTKTPFSRSIPERLRTKPHHKHLHKARSKHRPRSPSPPPPPFSTTPPPQQPSSPFLTRFFNLPAEIRLQIYRILLVRPCKFDLTHKFGCNVGIAGMYRPTTFDQLYSSHTFCCAECAPQRWRWQGLGQTITADTPARSAWARSKRNPYLCDRCYPEMLYRLGLKRWPSMELLECLCTRRESLGVLLMSRRIYDEAWPIFWAENMFAFENGRLLADFLDEIGGEKRARIRSIALLSPKEIGLYLEEEELPECWPLLRQCSGLRELELDSSLLDNFEFVQELRTVSVTKVRFTEKSKEMGFDSYDQGRRERKMTPWLAYRRVYTDPLVVLLTASMTQEVVDEEGLRLAFEQRARLQSSVVS
ncbi:hypothetical protein BJX63DRAFT_413672 [Aspergillus granulosus]|uniref:F-box domain-containing protein n=1 Tax=Aspergillus granulosus TaxID=176169 RepID=A0ABR4GUW1_9EURO